MIHRLSCWLDAQGCGFGNPKVVGSTQPQPLTDDKERRLAAAYSNTELAQKQLGFGGVFVVRNGVPISLLDKSIGNQAIKSQPFICIQIFGPFHAPSGHDIAKDRAGAGCLNSFSASISGASAGVRLPSGEAAA